MDLQQYSTFALLGCTVALLIIERYTGWRRSLAPIQHRWLTNVGLFFLVGIVASIVFPTSAIAVAAELPSGWLRSLPLAVETLLVLLLLDLWRYWEHRYFHEIPVLWRTHLVHHSDTHLDLTTAQRHHPLESILVGCTSLLLVFALGFSVQAFGLYLVLATVSSLLVHANLRLPEGIDRPLRRLLVTPAVHAVHHSSLQAETDSNYGTILTVWDRLFGTYVDPRYASKAHFGLEYFHQPRDTDLGPVLLQPFEYRANMDYPGRETVQPNQPRTSRAPLPPAWRSALPRLTIGLALLALALWPTSVSLVSSWTNDSAYQYAWLAVLMLIYMLGWYHRDKILALRPQADWLGLLILVPAIILWVAATLVHIKLAQQLAFMLIVHGFVLCVLGRAVYAAVLSTTAMLFLLIPSGDILQPVLRNLTVKWIEWYAIALQLPYSIEGFVAYVGEHRYVVIDACSGMPFVLIGGFLGYSFGLLVSTRFSKVLAMSLLGALLGVASNAIRVWLILSIDQWRGSQLDVTAHEGLQWLVLFATLGLLFYITLKLSGDRSSEQAKIRQHHCAAPPWMNRFAPAIYCLIIVAIAGGSQLAMHDSQATNTDTLDRLATHYPASQWQHQDKPELRYLSFNHTELMEVVVLEPRSQDGRVSDKLLGPEDRSAWRHTGNRHHTDCLADQCINFVHKTWRSKGNHEPRHTFYVYYTGQRLTDSKFTYRLANGWARLTGDGQAAKGLIGLQVRGGIPATSELARIVIQIRASGATSHSSLALNTRR